MLKILETLPENTRAQAADIFYEAFQRKLLPLLGKPEPTRQLITACLDLNWVSGVLKDGQLLGLLGLHTPENSLYLKVKLHDSQKAFGQVRGLFNWLVFNGFSQSSGCPSGHLRIAALAVAPAARGLGVGTLLLENLFDRARREGYQAVRLEVVNTNLAARRLYERLGFKVVQTHTYPIPQSWLGFNADHVMVKML